LARAYIRRYELTKHSRERALERYNIKLSKKDEADILEMIRNNQILPLGSVDNDNKKKFAYVVFNHIPLKVLYSRSNKRPLNIITVYPFDADEYNSLIQDDFQNKIYNAVAFLKRNGFIVYKRKHLTIPKSMTNT
jgi:hypothetical protein